MACHQHLWTAQTVDRRRAWHVIIAFGQHTQSYDVGRGMPSSPLASTHGRTTSGVACHHIPWTTNKVEQRRAWHSITAFGQYTRSNDVGHDMPSPPLDNTHGQMTTSVACHHPLWAAHTVELRRRCIPLSSLGSTNGRTTSGVACQHHLWAAHRRTTSGVACQHCLWAAHTVERC